MKRAPKPSALETQVLSVLWDAGPSPVRDVLARLPDRKPRAYTTVLSVLQVMERKGLVSRAKGGHADLWRARVSRGQVARPALRDLVRDLFGGSAALGLQHMVRQGDFTESELRDLERLLQERRKNQRASP